MVLVEQVTSMFDDFDCIDTSHYLPAKSLVSNWPSRRSVMSSIRVVVTASASFIRIVVRASAVAPRPSAQAQSLSRTLLDQT